MRRILTALAGLATVAALAPTPASAQISEDCYVAPDRPVEGRASPKNSIEFMVGGERAVLCWDAPQMREREIFGQLVPYGEMWRMGANEATAIHLTFAGDIGGVEVEPGSYSLYMIPGAETFEFFVNTDFERWGIPITPDVRQKEVGSFTRAPTILEEPVESLSFRYESHGENMGHIVMEWENTRVDIPVHKGMM